MAIMRHKPHGLDHGLGDQKPVKRILMVPGQSFHPHGMLG